MKVSKLPSNKPELFYSIQGEGFSAGIPSIFLRLALCNLQCKWCDTPYTWNWEGTNYETVSGQKFKKEDSIINLSVSEIIREFERFPSEHLIITGGEPLIQQKEISELVDALEFHWSIEIETNGTIIPDAISMEKDVQYNVSPKLPHSGNDMDKAIKPEVIEWFVSYENSFFKFVIGEEKDLELVVDLQYMYRIPPWRIILMPKGTTTSEIKQCAKTVAELCLSHGYRYSDRAHVHIWGDERAK